MVLQHPVVPSLIPPFVGAEFLSLSLGHGGAIPFVWRCGTAFRFQKPGWEPRFLSSQGHLSVAWRCENKTYT